VMYCTITEIDHNDVQKRSAVIYLQNLRGECGNQDKV
jgi:hypothetical protein